MSFLSLLALSKVTSALLCATLSHACEKVGLLHSGEVGTEAAHPRVCSWSPCFGCLPRSLVADAGLGICMWSLCPRERGCAQPSASGTAAPSRSIPRARLQQLCCCVQPTRVGMQPGTHPHSQQCQGTSQHPFPFLLSGLSSPRTLVASRDGQTLAAGEGGCRGCSTTWIYGALMYSSLPLAADAPCKSAPQMSRVVLRQLGLLALEDFAVASNKYTKTSAQAEQGEQ